MVRNRAAGKELGKWENPEITPKEYGFLSNVDITVPIQCFDFENEVVIINCSYFPES